MFLSCHGSRTRPAGHSARRPSTAWLLMSSASLAAPSAQAATEAGVGPATLGLLLLVALAVSSVAAYLLGATRTRLQTERALREARAEARLQTLLIEGLPWQTDALHRPVDAQAGAGAPPTTLFLHPEVQARLRTRRAFSELHVVLEEAPPGSRAWLLRAVPRQDDLGAFCGHSGSARPADADDSARSAAAVLQALLDAQPGASMLAVDHGNGWRVQQANAAARALWPQLEPGALLPAALPQLPPAVAAAFGSAAVVPQQHAGGWTLRAGEALPGAGRTLLLCQLPAASTAVVRGETEAQHTAESDSFSFTVSHDLRAPIRVVEGFTRIVKEDYGRLLDRVANDHLDRVLGAAARMNLMIDALLTLARLSTQPLTRQPVNLSQLAAYVVDELRRGAPEREAEIEIEPGLATVGDPTLLRLVLENLLGNAWKYSSRCAKCRITLTAVPHDGGVAYAIGDNGAGFDMRASERLFGLFQRLHSASEFPGTGVGLASVRRIVRRHGGEIWAEAEPGRGATFYFTLAG